MFLEDLNFQRTVAFVAGIVFVIISIFTYSNQHRVIQKSLKRLWVGFHKTRRKIEHRNNQAASLLDVMSELAVMQLQKVSGMEQLSLFLTIIMLFTLSGLSFAIEFNSTPPGSHVKDLMYSMLTTFTICLVYLYIFIKKPGAGMPATYLVWVIAVYCYPEGFEERYNWLMFIGAVIFALSTVMAISYIRILIWSHAFWGKFFQWSKAAAIKLTIWLIAMALLLPSLIKTVTHPCQSTSCFYNHLFADHAFIHFYADTLMTLPFIALFIVTLFDHFIGSLYLVWLSLSATTRAMFEHAVIKRRRLLLSIGCMLLLYALPNAGIIKTLKELLVDLVSAK